ncbi:LANO_0E05886g1_1 [Lachancea nothofagi CBS 11611]|uniref:LANO_0E05886g1_1 n=1 Tax=Lachancea nothofagi CBS 11611 TaxID=1266666 RepID=A0A1G4JTS3_9SACH|nr:LANO_0E05886g1_1 [Lachancea nothofagi CBS 11611]
MKEMELQRTPKRESAKRSSFVRENNEFEAASPKSPQTPSPPNDKPRRSSVSHGFLASPLPGSNLKRNSGSEFLIPESPGIKSRLLPPTTPKSKNTEMFLSPSPKLKSPGVRKDSERPIRELSNNLKTRLNYAFVKLQNGWADKTLPELESVIDTEKTGSAVDEPVARPCNTSYSNRFLEDEELGNNSAHAAFMTALASPKKKQRSGSSSSGTWTISSRKPPPPPISIKTSEKPKAQSKDQPSEVEAIETLMSLSSPKKPTHRKSQDFTLPPPPPFSQQQQGQSDQPIVAFSSRSSSSTSSIPNTLAKPFLLKSDAGTSTQVLLDVETDVEESNGD